MVSGIYFRGALIFILCLSIIAVWHTDIYGKTVPSLCRIKYPSDDKVETECRRLKKGETLESLFGDRWIDVARFNRIDRRHIYPGVFIKVPGKLDDIVNFTPMPQHYPPAEVEAKFILVDLSEQFLAAYEYGRLVFSAPITTGEDGNETPTGEFRVLAVDSRHVSSLYFVENTNKPYPMHYALIFYINKRGVAFCIHGRDVPGYPGSHGCIGLYDELMEKKYYGFPNYPLLEDARTLFEWVISPGSDDGRFHTVKDGPRVVITGQTPVIQARKH